MLDIILNLAEIAIYLGIAYLCLKWLNKHFNQAEKEYFERFWKYKEEREKEPKTETNTNKNNNTEPKPFTQDDMREWQMRNR